MDRLTKAIKMMSELMEKREAGEYLPFRSGKSLEVFNHIRRHYGVSWAMMNDIRRGDLRTK